MAVVILGGLVTSTLLNLFLMPALYLAFGRTRNEPEEELSSVSMPGEGWETDRSEPVHSASSMPLGSGG